MESCCLGSCCACGHGVRNTAQQGVGQPFRKVTKLEPFCESCYVFDIPMFLVRCVPHSACMHVPLIGAQTQWDMGPLIRAQGELRVGAALDSIDEGSGQPWIEYCTAGCRTAIGAALDCIDEA